MGLLVLAPPGAGKSTTARQRPDEFCDFDSLVEQALGWPLGHWWRDEHLARLTAQKHLALLTTLVQMKGKTILGHPGVSHLPECFADLTHAVWIPLGYRDRMAREMARREKQHKVHPSCEECLEAELQLRRWASDFGIDVVQDLHNLGGFHV